MISTSTPLISAEYRKLNAALHKSRPDYGAHGARWAEQVKGLIGHYQARDVLDYGCGKQSLAETLCIPFLRGYDPALPGLDDPPEPADLVVCTDVLEHIEPDTLTTVLDHLASLTRKALFVVVATRPATKELADGRNAHLIQAKPQWWLPLLMARLELRSYERINDGEFLAVLEKRP